MNAIQVSGSQSGEWTPDNNPYQIIGDVTVPATTTLTVLPGVIVQAMGNYQIIAQGNIIANGTEQDSIKFVSGLLDQTIIWKGIRLENTTVTSLFSYCKIELGQYGINSINSPVSIAYCHFNKNQKGIQAYGIGAAIPANVLINHNLIEYSQHNGILVAQNSNTSILNNDICHNGLTAQYYGAIQLSNQSAGGSNNAEIAFNHIHDNHKQGIIAWDIVSANAIQPEVYNNLIENNLTGIYFRHASGYLHHNTVINNFIPGDMNSGAGIMVSGNTAQPYFENNTITGNYTGFYLTENAKPILGDLSSNHAWAQGENQIANNIDANSVMHSIVCYQYTAPTFTVKAENNLWDYNSAAQIDSTITDFNDNPAFPTIDYAPWINNPVPIYLAGTIISNNPQLTSVSLQLVSVQTGTIINEWTIQCNVPFQQPVYHDSLVYIVATGTDLSQVQYMAAYGGLQNPTATQMVADVQLYIGELILSNELPNWSLMKIGTPQTINGHFSYPLSKGWFVYAPTVYYWLFRDGDFLRVSQIATNFNNDYQSFMPLNTPVWRRIDTADSVVAWIQMTTFTMSDHSTVETGAALTDSITTFANGQASLYNRVDAGFQIQVYDHFLSQWMLYNPAPNHFIHDMEIEVPVTVEPDGTLFPLQTGNVWKIVNTQQNTVPTYFGYRIADALSFYWIAPRSGYNYTSYKLFDNGALITELPLIENSYTIPIPYDDMEHTYTLSAWDGTNNNYALTPIVLAFTHTTDEYITPQVFSVYPNPFNPTYASLTVKYDISKATSAKLSVYNLKGQLVWKTEVDKKANELTWNGKDNQGRKCASGLYQMQLIDNIGHKINRKLMLIH